jgi:hypothetical protein
MFQLPWRRNLVAGIGSALSNWMFIREITNMSNWSWLKGMEIRLISVIPIEDIAEKTSKMIQRFWLQKNNHQF